MNTSEASASLQAALASISFVGRNESTRRGPPTASIAETFHAVKHIGDEMGSRHRHVHWAKREGGNFHPVKGIIAASRVAADCVGRIGP